MADHQPLLTRIQAWCRRVTRRDVAADPGGLKSGFGAAAHPNAGPNADMAATLEAIPDLMFELDADGRHWDFRARRTERLVAPPENLLGHTVFEVMPIEAARAVMAALAEATSTGSSEGTQILLPTPMGERWFEISIARKETKAREGQRFIVLSRDITERKQAQEAVERLAFFDALTDLPNRRLLMDRLQQTLAASARSGNLGALLFIDLDNFKTLNDTKGHEAGDLLLQQAAQRLRTLVRGEDTVSRLGGDEFVVMLVNLGNDDARAAAQVAVIGGKIVDRLGEVYVLDGSEYRCTASVGASMFGGQTRNAGELLRFADMAMYSAKKAGRNKLMFFDAATQATPAKM